MRFLRAAIGLVFITVGVVTIAGRDITEAAPWLLAGGVALVGLVGILAAFAPDRDTTDRP